MCNLCGRGVERFGFGCVCVLLGLILCLGLIVLLLGFVC